MVIFVIIWIVVRSSCFPDIIPGFKWVVIINVNKIIIQEVFLFDIKPVFSQLVCIISVPFFYFFDFPDFLTPYL